MIWMLVAAALVAGTLATFTDWLFMGVMFHARYLRYPDVWWPAENGNRRKIIISSMLGYVASAAIVALAAIANMHGVGNALCLAIVAWIAGPLVVIVTNGFWIRIDPRITLAHCLGWLARFAIAGLTAGLVLR